MATGGTDNPQAHNGNPRVKRENGFEEVSQNRKNCRRFDESDEETPWETTKDGQRDDEDVLITGGFETDDVSLNGELLEREDEENDTDVSSLAKSTRSDNELSMLMKSNDSVAAVMPHYVQGQPMPNPQNCLFMQSHTMKIANQKIRRYMDKLKRKPKYYKVALTNELILCVSDGSSDVILFTVDLNEDKYNYEKGEDEDKLHLPENGVELCFNTSTTPVMREKIAFVKSKTVAGFSEVEKPQMRDRKAKSFSTRDVTSFGQPLMKRVVGFDKKESLPKDSEHKESFELLPSPVSMSPPTQKLSGKMQNNGEHATLLHSVENEIEESLFNDIPTADEENPSVTTSHSPSQLAFPQQVKDEDNMLEEKMPGKICQPLEVPHIDACPTGSGNSVQEAMQKTVTSCSQLQSPHSETNRHTSREDVTVPIAVSCEQCDDEKTEVVCGKDGCVYYQSKKNPVQNLAPDVFSATDTAELQSVNPHEPDTFVLQPLPGRSNSRPLQLFRTIELFKWEVSNLLGDKHDWPVFLNLLGISGTVQRDISKHCFAQRCYYEIVDAFECRAIQQDYARTPEILLEKLQQKLPDLRKELAGCLKAAQSFEIPTLNHLDVHETKLQQKPTKCLLQKVAFSPSLCKKAYFTGRLLGLSKDDVDVLESVTFHDKLSNPAERFLSEILKKWESKSHHGECTIAALLRVVIFLEARDALDKVLEHVQNPVLEQ